MTQPRLYIQPWHRDKAPAGYSAWCWDESDTTDWLPFEGAVAVGKPYWAEVKLATYNKVLQENGRRYFKGAPPTPLPTEAARLEREANW